MKGAFCFILLLISGYSQLTAQPKPTKEQTTLWNRLHIIKKTPKNNTIGVLIENRQYIQPWRGHMFLAELNYKKYMTQRTKLGLHTTYLIFTLPHDPHSATTERKDELRFHQSLGFQWLKTRKQGLSSRLMLEERFFKSFVESQEAQTFGFEYVRLRTRLTYSRSLSERLTWIVSDEFMFQSQEDLDVGFDQNRLDFIFRYGLTPKVAFDIGYLNWYQERDKINYLRHSIRTGVFVRL